MDGEKPRASKPRATGATISDEVKTFIRNEAQRVDAGFKDAAGAKRRRASLKQMLSYLEAKGITHPAQITENTMEDYPIFRAERSAHTTKTDLKDISVFLKHHLLRNKLISNEIGSSPYLIPKIKMNFLIIVNLNPHI